LKSVRVGSFLTFHLNAAGRSIAS